MNEIHEKHMQHALQYAKEALNAGEFPVGCVIVHKNHVVATGRRTNSAGTVNELDHAEMIALRNLLTDSPNISPKEVTVYASLEPCLMCYSTLLVNGIRHIVWAYEDAMGGGTNLPLDKLAPLYRNADVTIQGGVLRKQSLALFQEFFGSPSTAYLKDTLLAEYTMSQHP